MLKALKWSREKCQGGFTPLRSIHLCFFIGFNELQYKCMTMQLIYISIIQSVDSVHLIVLRTSPCIEKILSSRTDCHFKNIKIACFIHLYKIKNYYHLSKIMACMPPLSSSSSDHKLAIYSHQGMLLYIFLSRHSMTSTARCNYIKI